MHARPQRGFTLIEVLIAFVVIGLLVALGMPSFSTWLQSSQIRTAAEAVQNGLSLARTEAVGRNTTVRFHLTDTLTNACNVSTSGTNWIISLDDAEDLCGTAPSTTIAPRIIQVRSSNEGSPNVSVSATQSVVVFNALGRVTPTPAGNITIDVTNPKGGTCAASGGNMRCLRIVVAPGGQVRMCDPKIASTDPQGC